MQKIGQLQAYVEVGETQGATFLHPEGTEEQARLIKMRILSEAAVNLYVEAIDADPETGEVEDLRFLTHVPPGIEQIEFYYKGSFALRLVGGNIWLDTYDNTSFNVEAADPTSFARLIEREERDPRILEIEQAARHNKRLFDEQRSADLAAYEARINAMEERLMKNVSTPSSDAGAAKTSIPAKSSIVPPTDDKSDAGTAEGGTGGEPKAGD